MEHNSENNFLNYALDFMKVMWYSLSKAVTTDLRADYQLSAPLMGTAWRDRTWKSTSGTSTTSTALGCNHCPMLLSAATGRSWTLTR